MDHREGKPRLDDPSVDAHAAAMVSLHRALLHYRSAKRRQDGLEVAQSAMAAGEAGHGVATVVLRLLERLRAGLLEQMRWI